MTGLKTALFDVAGFCFGAPGCVGKITAHQIRRLSALQQRDYPWLIGVELFDPSDYYPEDIKKIWREQGNQSDLVCPHVCFFDVCFDPPRVYPLSAASVFCL